MPTLVQHLSTSKHVGKRKKSSRSSGLFRIQKDEECVKEVMEVVENWRNPFEKSEEF